MLAKSGHFATSPHRQGDGLDRRRGKEPGDGNIVCKLLRGMDESTLNPVLKDLDREAIVLRLGTILRKLNVLTQRQVGLDPVSGIRGVGSLCGHCGLL